MVFDKIVETPGLVHDLKALTAIGRLDLVTTHVQNDELQRAADSAKRKALGQIPCRTVPTAAFVFGVSRLGQARLGTGEEGGLSYRELKIGNPRHTRDAIIALTAAREADVFVSEDRQLRNKMKASAHTLDVWNFAQFLAHIMHLKGNRG